MMFPRQNQGDVGLGAAEKLGYFGLRHRPTDFSDFGDVISGEQLLESSDATDVDSVLSVTVVSGPFEVGSNVIPFVPVNVVDHGKIAGIRDKGERNQAMDMDRFAFPVSVKVDVPVSEFVCAGTKYSTAVKSRLSSESYADSIDTANVSEVADFVKFFVASDRNGSPFFFSNDTHSTGCPSVNGSSTIKSPSHAVTFGGFAFMASTSEAYNRRN